MRIRITASKPREGEKGIEHLIGREYDAEFKDNVFNIFHIKYGPADTFIINSDECEVIEDKTQCQE